MPILDGGYAGCPLVLARVSDSNDPEGEPRPHSTADTHADRRTPGHADRPDALPSIPAGGSPIGLFGNGIGRSPRVSSLALGV